MTHTPLSEQEQQYLRNLLEDFQRILANAKLAYQDLMQGDGYEAGGYLKNIRTWAGGGEGDLQMLLVTLNPPLQRELAQKIEDEDDADWDEEEEDEDDEEEEE